MLSETLGYIIHPQTQHVPEAGFTFVDATVGAGGHAFEAALLLGNAGRLIGIDQDETALALAHERLETLPQGGRPLIELFYGNFGDLDALLLEAQTPGIDAILFDLGVSSMMLDEISRGFSFKKGMATLDMRMDLGNHTLNAAEILDTYSVSDLHRVFRDYGEEKWAKRIAEFIVSARVKKRIETSEELVAIIKAAIPASARRSGGHPAKRVFQALRVEVNAELAMLQQGLDAAIRWLNPGGHVAVISYQSLEDRIVKDTFAAGANRCVCPPDLPVCVCGKRPVLEMVTRKPVLPSAEEVACNARARSAKLRVARKL
jgi:16S rRNA (cytosine1402-N4)-methyltransferase